MNKMSHGEYWDEPNTVPDAADSRIRREALRQLDTIDLSNDNARIEPLPNLGMKVHGAIS